MCPDLSACVAAVHEHDIPAGLVRLGQVLLVDPVCEGGGCGVVHQLEDVQSRHPEVVIIVEIVTEEKIFFPYFALSNRALLSASVK